MAEKLTIKPGNEDLDPKDLLVLENIKLTQGGRKFILDNIEGAKPKESKALDILKAALSLGDEELNDEIKTWSKWAKEGDTADLKETGRECLNILMKSLKDSGLYEGNQAGPSQYIEKKRRERIEKLKAEEQRLLNEYKDRTLLINELKAQIEAMPDEEESNKNQIENQSQETQAKEEKEDVAPEEKIKDLENELSETKTELDKVMTLKDEKIAEHIKLRRRNLLKEFALALVTLMGSEIYDYYKDKKIKNKIIALKEQEKELRVKIDKLELEKDKLENPFRALILEKMSEDIKGQFKSYDYNKELNLEYIDILHIPKNLGGEVEYYNWHSPYGEMNMIGFSNFGFTVCLANAEELGIDKEDVDEITTRSDARFSVFAPNGEKILENASYLGAKNELEKASEKYKEELIKEFNDLNK